MAASLSSGLEEIVTCPICCDQFQDPRVLPCLHTYCKECLERLLAGKTTISCPECRKTVQIQDIDKLQVNFQINNLTSLLAGEKAKVTEPQKSSSFCQKHKEALKLFCETCENVICCECLVFDHNGHRVDLLENIAKTRKELLTKGIKPIMEFNEQAKFFTDEIFFQGNLKQEILNIITEEERHALYDLMMDITILKSNAEYVKEMLARDIQSEIVSMFRQLIQPRDEMIRKINASYKKFCIQWELNVDPVAIKIEPISPQVSSVHYKQGVDAKISRPIARMNGERIRKPMRPISFPAATLRNGQDLEAKSTAHENAMKELQSKMQLEDPKSVLGNRKYPPKTLPKMRISEERKEDIGFSSSNSSADVHGIMPRKGLYNTSINEVSESKSPKKCPPKVFPKRNSMQIRQADISLPSTLPSNSLTEIETRNEGMTSGHGMLIKELQAAQVARNSGSRISVQPPQKAMAVNNKEGKTDETATNVASLKQKFERI